MTEAVTLTHIREIDKHILFENDDLVAVNKPSGMLSIPDREQTEISLKDILQKKYGNIFTVHRLDKDTSGVIIFAKNSVMHKYLSERFEGRDIEKYYSGLVLGVPYESEATIDAPIMEHPTIKGKMIVHQKGKPSVTDYKVLESFGKYAYLQFRIHTGRTHQIRVHCKNMGTPILCDALYGDGTPILLSAIKKKYKLSKMEMEEQPIVNRLALHSYQLIFTLPDGQKVNIEAELPKDMRALMQQLRKHLH